MDDNTPFQPGAECPKCQGSMEKGFLLDRTHGGAHQGMWCPGEPKPSFWPGHVKSAHKASGIYIVTYRCAACGYLESYAPPRI